MRTIVEGARAQMIDSGLLLNLWAKSMSTMVYPRIWSTRSAIEDKMITPLHAWHKDEPPAVDHIRIFGSTAYIFDKTKPKLKLASKTRTAYLISYERHYQYRIYDPTWQAVYIRCNVIFDKNTVGPPRASPISDVNNVDSIGLRFSILSLSLIPWLNDIDETAQTPNLVLLTEITLANSSPKELLPEKVLLPTNNLDTSSELSDLPDNLDQDNPGKLDKPNIPIPVQCKSACLSIQPMLDYWKINQGKTVNSKLTHLFYTIHHTHKLTKRFFSMFWPIPQLKHLQALYGLHRKENAQSQICLA